VPEQEELEQPEDLPEFVVVDDDDDDNYGYYGGGWVDTDTEEEPMELPEDQTRQVTAMRMLHEETVPIQVSQEEIMHKMVMRT
jgi:hypothetical protein